LHIIDSRIIELTAKENSIEDCMAVLKKSYEKDQISMQEFLQQVRKLSGKQFRQVVKRNKIMKALEA